MLQDKKSKLIKKLGLKPRARSTALSFVAGSVLRNRSTWGFAQDRVSR
ncbi:MAG: hypothetical protein V7K27_08905 [Nostoc sp.]